MFFITILGLFLRLTNIIKPEGLWNDEYVSWMVASTPFNENFFSAVLKQCHMPLYYLYLKPFVNCSDTVLRLSSVVPSIIAIFIMYCVGKEYSRKCGYVAAAITSILSFLIYYAQEVRFYSILFLFSALSLLFTIRLIKNSSKLNLLGYAISNILILFTHVLGIIYVGLNLIYMLKKKQFLTRKMLYIFIVPIIIILLLGLRIISQIPSAQWWGHFSYTNIMFMFSDFLSPVLTNNINAPPVFFYNKSLAIWLTVPTIIGSVCMLYGVKQNKGLSLIALLTVIITALLAANGTIVFITKYLIEILPIIILLFACGCEKLKRIGIALFVIFILFHVSYFFTPNYVTKQFRNEGNNIPCEILYEMRPQKVIFTYYAPDRFLRYRKEKAQAYSVNKSNRFEFRYNPEKILNNINSGEKVSVVFLDSVSFFPESYINHNEKYLPEMFVTFSHIKNIIIDEINKKYIDVQVISVGSWSIITAIKK